MGHSQVSSRKYHHIIPLPQYAKQKTSHHARGHTCLHHAIMKQEILELEKKIEAMDRIMRTAKII